MTNRAINNVGGMGRREGLAADSGASSSSGSGSPPAPSMYGRGRKRRHARAAPVMVVDDEKEEVEGEGKGKEGVPPVADDVVSEANIVSGKRRRAAVDYRKLNGELFLPQKPN